ncbi:DUF6153 family protein [Streptomyces spirodelae]|uniref:DUF2946 domain-containing protein n=1 Tax=Streptomyces spirodelae TaxID=2812904 RepID=A0ABS3WTQ5_9ACTN|nr:DUF6153 family protein [Streptomyces spirodelae]MBO8186483.1 hypothetical protein [Streptomyces spirodelae]
MPGRVRLHWLVLFATCVLAVGHGFAGAATHLPYYPDHALVTHAASEPQAVGTEPPKGHDGHGDTSCEIITGGFPHLQPDAEGSPAVAPGEVPLAVLPRGVAAASRAPPKPSLTALSVLRI